MVAALTLSSDARLGETRGIVNGPDGRYGEPTGETTPSLEGSQDKVDVFKKDKIAVTTEYDEQGKIWRITYQRKGLSDSLIDNLLSKNGGKRTWSKPTKFMDNRYWVTIDKELHAAYYGNPVYKLVIMTNIAAEAKRHPQTLEGRETKRVAEDKTGEDPEPEKTTKDPLEGF